MASVDLALVLLYPSGLCRNFEALPYHKGAARRLQILWVFSMWHSYELAEMENGLVKQKLLIDVDMQPLCCGVH